MGKGVWIVGTFFAMYGIATLVGFATYFLFSPLIMWVSVFTLMPVISGLLVYGYLLKQKPSPGESLRESLLLAGVWMLLSFCLDAITYILIVPYLHHSAPNWCFFYDQSPWIWISYLILLISALLAQAVYTRRIHA